MSSWVITAVGPDQPGLVGRLTAPLLESSSNVADSRMINLRGQFALLLLVEIPSGREAEVREALREVAVDLQLDLGFHGSLESTQYGSPPGIPYRLRIFAMDQPGIIHRITDLLHRHGVNVEELETRSQPRPQSGAPLFSLDARMTLPVESLLRDLKAELNEVCDDLNCDLELIRASLA